MAKSIKAAPTNKPEKPYEGFPLIAHATGRWAKKVRGKTCYFGIWNEPEAALDKFNRECPYLSKGRVRLVRNMWASISAAGSG